MNNRQDRASIADQFRQLQDEICASLEAFDGQGRFVQDLWERPGGGGGRTRVISGQVIEKGGVNFSAVSGDMPERIAGALGLKAEDFFATGVSIVLHPLHPLVPIIHMNVRYFECGDTWWFGGGIDLTPHYVDEAEATHFHRRLQAVCDAFHPGFYAEFKRWADEYFYIRHRKETRGIGGIFFDRLSADRGMSKEALLAFVLAVGRLFAPLYTEIAAVRKDMPYTEAQQQWQYLRRGRYAEFNLVYDKGTKFGLDTDGRTESILMSLPPRAHWAYDHSPAEGSEEAHTLDLLKQGIDWAVYSEQSI